MNKLLLSLIIIILLIALIASVFIFYSNNNSNNKSNVPSSVLTKYSELQKNNRYLFFDIQRCNKETSNDIIYTVGAGGGFIVSKFYYDESGNEVGLLEYGENEDGEEIVPKIPFNLKNCVVIKNSNP